MLQYLRVIPSEFGQYHLLTKTFSGGLVDTARLDTDAPL